MKKERKSLFNRVVSFALAVVMIFSVAAVAGPETVRAADPTLKSAGGTITITDDTCYANTGEITYIKYTANANGYLQLKFASASSVVSYAYGKVQLYNSKKGKSLSTVLNYDTSSTSAGAVTEYYGVKKGTTYYIAVAAVGGVKVTAKLKKVTDKSGTKKTKSLTIKKGKSTTGVITAGTTTAHWYKFKMTKKQKVNFSITPYLTDSVQVTLSGPGVYTRTFTISSNYWGKKDPITTTNAVKAGTYYVRVKPASKTCTGYYTVSWK